MSSASALRSSSRILSVSSHGRSFLFCRFADKVRIDVNLGVGGAVWDRGGAGNWLWMDHRPGWVDLLDPQVKLVQNSGCEDLEVATPGDPQLVEIRPHLLGDLLEMYAKLDTRLWLNI